MTQEISCGADIESSIRRTLDSIAVVPKEALALYAIDGIYPKAAVLPSALQELATILEVAHTKNWTVFPRGSGNLMTLGNKPERVDLVIETRGLDTPIAHAPGDLTVTVSGGSTLSDLQSVLEREDQWLPIDPPVADDQTVGGVLATNLPGFLSLGYGTLRDMVIGIQVIGPDGTITKSGGKVVENVTDSDMGKIHIGALGTLGIITEVSFKVIPLPAKDVSLLALFDSLDEALSASSKVTQLPGSPQALAVATLGMNRRTDDGRLSDPGTTVYVRFLGSERSTERRLNDCRDLLWEAGAVNVQLAGGKAAKDTWTWLANFGWDPESGVGLLVRLGCVPSKVSEMTSQIEAILAREVLEAGLVIAPDTGVIKAFLPGVKWTDPNFMWNALSNLRTISTDLGGYCVVETCPAEVKMARDMWGDVGEGLSLVQRLKNEIDPNQILNPGRL